MDRRNFLARFAAVGLLASGWTTAHADDSAPADLTITPDGPGVSIPADFLGLSYESAQLPLPDFFSPENHSLVALIRRLGSKGVLRTGGNSSEFSLWRANGDQTVVPNLPKRYIVTPADIGRMAEFVRASGWRLIYGLNLGNGSPADAAAEAAAVARSVGDSLLAFQIGNEPDLFSHNGLRPKTYGIKDYLAEWKMFADAVRARVPNVPFAGPDTSYRTDWVSAMEREDAVDLVLLSDHYYADGPARSPKVTIDRLLNSGGRLSRTLRPLQQAAHSSHLPYRLTEANSCYGGGKRGVSDTFASALWGVDLLFQAAAGGCAGVNFHGGPGSAYTPIAQTSKTTQEYEPRPLYYGLLLFAQSSQGRLVPASFQTFQDSLMAYAVRNDNGGLQITVINKDDLVGASLTVDPGRTFRAGTALRLTAPALDSTTGVTLAGSSVASDSFWMPSPGEAIHFQGRHFLLNVPAASAVTVTLGA